MLKQSLDPDVGVDLNLDLDLDLDLDLNLKLIGEGWEDSELLQPQQVFSRRVHGNVAQ